MVAISMQLNLKITETSKNADSDKQTLFLLNIYYDNYNCHIMPQNI